MKAIISSIPPQVVEIENKSIIPTAIKIKTTFAPLLRYDQLTLNNSHQKIMGYGATGIVTEVGILRSPKLMNQHVLFLNPRGTFQEYNISSIPPYCLPIPEHVSDQEAAALIGGADIAMVLLKKIQKTDFDQIIILGANSIVSLALMQLINQNTDLKILPRVRDHAKSFLITFADANNIKFDQKPSSKPLVIDTANQGYLDEINFYLSKNIDVWSVSRNDILGASFISQPLLPSGYQFLLGELAAGRLSIPIDKIFQFYNINHALTYLSSPARGRTLIQFS